MALQRIELRMDNLEERVTRLEELPARMDRLESQIVLLRTEMRDEFSAVRGELGSVETGLRQAIDDARRETRVLHEAVMSNIALLGEGHAGSGRKRKGPRKS